MGHETLLRADNVDLHDRAVGPIQTHLVDGSEDWQMAIELRAIVLFPVQILHVLSLRPNEQSSYVSISGYPRPYLPVRFYNDGLSLYAYIDLNRRQLRRRRFVMS